MKAVPTEPIMYPANKNASGIAKIPVPKHPFSKWNNVSKFLEKSYRRDDVTCLSISMKSHNTTSMSNILSAYLGTLDVMTAGTYVVGWSTSVCSCGS